MPELPDVEVFRRYLNSTGLHQKIERVEVQDDRILEGVGPDELAKTLAGRELDSTTRHGKYLFARFAKDGWLVLHFGMTGYLQYQKTDQELPSQTRVRCDFDNGYCLALVCQRMLGEVGLTSDIEDFVRDRKLGPDACSLTFDDFRDLLSNRRGTIKSAMTNQSVLAGMGNIYADEILYQSGIRPDRANKDLNEDEVKRVYYRMLGVLDTAIKCKVNPERVPGDWLLTHRGECSECPRCGSKIRVLKMSGRTAYYCPNCQPER